MRPARLTPVEVLVQRHPHGTRVRYVTGCHCVECRAANTRYEHQRQLARIRGDWNGLVPAGRARAHILSLARAGVASAELERREALERSEAEALGQVLGSAEEGISHEEVERRVRRLTIQPVPKEES